MQSVHSNIHFLVLNVRVSFIPYYFVRNTEK